MKKWIKIIIVFSILPLLFCVFTFEYAIPKAAKLAVPFQWRHIPIGQKKTLVYEYLGTPSQNDLQDSSWDRWAMRSNSNLYILEIAYDKDTAAVIAKISYRYRLGFIHREYLLYADTAK